MRFPSLVIEHLWLWERNGQCHLWEGSPSRAGLVALTSAGGPARRERGPPAKARSACLNAEPVPGRHPRELRGGSTREGSLPSLWCLPRSS